MLELYFKYPRVIGRLRTGALGKEMDCIAAHYAAIGYKRSSVKIFFGHLARFSSFAKDCGHRDRIDAAIVERFLRSRPTPASCIGAQTALGHAMRLAPHRFAKPARPDKLSPDDRLCGRYETYLRQIRGLEPKTREGLLLVAHRLLAWHRERDTRRLSELNGADVLEVVQAFLATSQNGYTRSCTMSYLRSFFRYMQWSGLNTMDLARFVPQTPGWRLAHIPPRLPWDDLRHAIERIDATSAIGKRDRAMMLLVASTGLRNKELRHLELSDIHWQRGEILVRQTKTHRDRVVPLTHEAGAALAAYVLHARPEGGSRRVFLAAVPPIRPIERSSTISMIVARRLRLAGIKVSRGGAHLLRHSLATQLVSQARPINEVADLLGHQSIDTTAIYVKVALPQLSAVALPFPGGVA